MNGLLLPRPTRVPIEQIPDIAAAVRAAGLLTDEDGARLDAILDSQWVLVRIDGIGERWRCNRCGARHAHFTTFCVERPFRGLGEGLRVYWQNLGDAGERDLSPEQRQRLASLGRLFGPAPLSPLSAHHPRSARAVRTAASEIDIGAWTIGTIDPITPAEARMKIALINARAGRTILRA